MWLRDGIAMENQDRIFVKIQIEKNPDSGELRIRTHFDPEAPNFFQDKDDISWCPTPQEIAFLNETFELIPHYKGKESHLFNRRNEENIEDVKVTETETSISETVENKEKEVEFEPVIKKKEQNGRIIVTSDVNTIDEAIRKKEDSTEFIEANEETIIDRVLKQKKKGKL